jgi:phosphoenolpyruvate carboxykinase (ATP)
MTTPTNTGVSTGSPGPSSRDERVLKYLGLRNLGRVYWNLPTPALCEEAVRRYEGMLSHLGPLVVRTGQHTGRLPKDKFLVREPSSEDRIWWGKVNRPIAADRFERLQERLCSYLQGKDVFVEDCYAGADPQYRIPLRIVTERAWHAMFARNMFHP